MNNNILRLNDDGPYETHGSHKEMIEDEKYNNYSQKHEFSNNGGNEEFPPEGEGEMTEEERFFKDFTNQDIDNKDPSLGDYLIKIYEEEIPFEVRYLGDNFSEKDRSVFTSLICKILMTDEMSEKIDIKIEIANDNDLLFYYTADITTEIFEKLKEEQKLTCNFTNFSDLLIKNFDLCINNKKTYLAVLNVQKNKNAIMELMENLEYKSVDLISLFFVPASKDLIEKQISYRYNSLRAMDEIMQNRIEIVNGVLKDYDPQLITEIKKEIEKINSENNSLDKEKNKNIKNSKVSINSN